MGLVAESGPNYAEAIGEDPLPSLVWSHLALTSDGEDLRLYFNGEVIDTVETLPPRATDKPLRLGCSETWGSFEGLIDEVRIYDRALGIEEIGDDLAEDRSPGPRSDAPARLDPPRSQLRRRAPAPLRGRRTRRHRWPLQRPEQQR